MPAPKKRSPKICACCGEPVRTLRMRCPECKDQLQPDALNSRDDEKLDMKGTWACRGCGRKYGLEEHPLRIVPLAK